MNAAVVAGTSAREQAAGFEGSPGPLLSVRGVSKRFPGVVALDKVDFDIRAHEIHALMGENGAGKSTLMKIVTGVYRADSGKISVLGHETPPVDPRDAQRLGIAVIHQEINQVPELTVYENFFLGRERCNKVGLVRRNLMRGEAQQWIAKVGLKVPVDMPLRHLRVAQRQLLEIARAISLHSAVLLMDEPTTALSTDEVTHLFGIVRGLRDAGMGIAYISHRMEEVFALADRITVLRDGRHVATRPSSSLSRDSLIQLMVGRSLPEMFPKGHAEPGATVLRVDRLSANKKPGGQSVKDVSLRLRAGEVTGLAGLLGAGRTELLEALFGVRHHSALRGCVEIDGKAVKFKTPREAISGGMGFVAEDRKGQSLALGRPVRENITLASLNRFSRHGFLRMDEERLAVEGAIRSLRIKTPSASARVGTLSGGNQQKVVLARYWILRPKVFLLDEPTQGIDVGAKAEIYALIRSLADDGAAILMASSDMPELMGLCDRILVMCEGRMTGELSRGEATQERILDLATRFGHEHQPSERQGAPTP
jgi:ABC-type sugar transport system ATPase subunit